MSDDKIENGTGIEIDINQANERSCQYWDYIFTRQTATVNNDDDENGDVVENGDDDGDDDDNDNDDENGAVEMKKKEEKNIKTTTRVPQNGKGESEFASEWLLAYSVFRDIFRAAAQIACGRGEDGGIKKDPSILIVGSGLSTLSMDLYDDGFHHITSSDISPVVVEHMRARCADRHSAIAWTIASVFDMPHIPTAAFDVVIDKAVLDTVMFRHPAPQRPMLAARTVSEYARVLVPGTGICFVVSPRRRLVRCAPSFREWTQALPTVVLQPPAGGDISVVSGKYTDHRNVVYAHVYQNPVSAVTASGAPS